MRKSMLSILGLVVGLAVAAACAGEAPTPVVVEKEVPVTVIKEVVKAVEVPVVVEKEVPVEVIKEVLVEKEKRVVVEVEVTPTPRPTPTPTATPLPVPKVFRIGLLDDLTTTNIWNILGPEATAWNFYALLNRYPFLYGLSDVRFDWVPAWADGFPTPFVQEGDLWTTTVKIQPEAKWSDGQPITAGDVAFTIKTVLELELPGNWPSLIDPEVVDHAAATDAKTLKIYFKDKPGLARWQFGVSGVPFVAKHFWEPLVNQAKQAGATLEEQRQALLAIVPQNEPTAGEMVFVKWEKGAFVEVDVNPNYFFSGSKVTEYANGAYLEQGPSYTSGPWYGEATGDVALEFTRGPHIESAIYSIYGSQDTAVLALQKGEIDYLATPLGLQRGFQVQLAGKPDVKVIVNAPNGFRYLAFNTRKAPQGILEFRQAVAVLIDKEFVTSTILQGVADPAYTAVPPGNGFWYNPDVPQLGKGLSREGRINQAVALLKSAGFTYEVEPKWDATKRAVDPGSGLKMPNGDPVPAIELLAPSPGYDPLRSTFAIWIEQWLKEAGIPVKANLTGFNVIVDKVFVTQTFDMYILGWGLTIFPDYLRDFFHSSRAGVGDFNTPGYSNSEFDALSDTLVSTTDINEARTIAFQLQEFLAEESPYVVLFTTQILEPFRTVVKFPFETVLDGIQNYLQSANGPLAYTKIE